MGSISLPKCIFLCLVAALLLNNCNIERSKPIYIENESPNSYDAGVKSKTEYGEIVFNVPKDDKDADSGMDNPDHPDASQTGNQECNYSLDCPVGFFCHNSTCQKIECQTDDGCPEDKICKEFLCTEDAGCIVNADCAIVPMTPFCDSESGDCVQCVKKSNCTEGSNCEEGVCTITAGGGGSEPPGPCKVGEECCNTLDGNACMIKGCHTISVSTPRCIIRDDDFCPPDKIKAVLETGVSDKICYCLDKCVETKCRISSDCPDPKYPICDMDEKRCVECRVDYDCPLTEICNQLTKRCEQPSPPPPSSFDAGTQP